MSCNTQESKCIQWSIEARFDLLFIFSAEIGIVLTSFRLFLYLMIGLFSLLKLDTSSIANCSKFTVRQFEKRG